MSWCLFKYALRGKKDSPKRAQSSQANSQTLTLSVIKPNWPIKGRRCHQLNARLQRLCIVLYWQGLSLVITHMKTWVFVLYCLAKLSWKQYLSPLASTKRFLLDSLGWVGSWCFSHSPHLNYLFFTENGVILSMSPILYLLFPLDFIYCRQCDG